MAGFGVTAAVLATGYEHGSASLIPAIAIVCVFVGLIAAALTAGLSVMSERLRHQRELANYQSAAARYSDALPGQAAYDERSEQLAADYRDDLAQWRLHDYPEWERQAANANLGRNHPDPTPTRNPDGPTSATQAWRNAQHACRITATTGQSPMGCPDRVADMGTAAYAAETIIDMLASTGRVDIQDHSETRTVLTVSTRTKAVIVDVRHTRGTLFATPGSLEDEAGQRWNLTAAYSSAALTHAPAAIVVVPHRALVRGLGGNGYLDMGDYGSIPVVVAAVNAVQSATESYL